jgi:hypothetical protein
MTFTILSLATAMFLISKAARTDPKGSTDESTRHDCTLSLLVCTSILAGLSGYALYASADITPAIICVFVIPFLVFLPGTRNKFVRFLGLALVSVGGMFLFLPPNAFNQDGAMSTRQALEGERPAPLIVFDDISRNKELLARARALESELDVMISGQSSARMNSLLPAMKAEVESIIRLLKSGTGEAGSTALRLARLESSLQEKQMDDTSQ